MSTGYSRPHAIPPGTKYFDMDGRSFCEVHYARLPTIDAESIEKYLNDLEPRPYVKVISVRTR